jgi:threonine dehydratase
MEIREVREPGIDDLHEASAIVRRHLKPTPLIQSTQLGDHVSIKLETLQPTGSFKVRGAIVAISKIIAREPDARILAASAGNHGLGVAFASALLGVRATVVVPTNASPAKLEALKRFDAEVIGHGDSYDEAEAYALNLTEPGSHFVSAYNDSDVIAGQSTVMTELREQVLNLASIVVPVGGGGLIAGIALAACVEDRDVSVFGVEAKASPAVSTAIRAGHTVPIEVRPTIADGLAGNLEPGSVTVGIIAQHVKHIVGVDEKALRDAIRFLVKDHGLVAEASGAAGIAAILSGALEVPADRSGETVLVLSGRNISTKLLDEVLREPTDRT